MSPQVTRGIRATGDGRGAGRGAERAISAWQSVRRFARGVLGSDAYDVYLHHHRITGCAHEPLSEKAFWREKYADQGANPTSGCC